MPVEMSRTGPDLDRTEMDSREQLDALVLEHLRRTANVAGIAKASKRSLAVALPISPATAQRSLARLTDAGRIELVSIGTGGRYQSRFRVLAVVPAQPAA